MSPEQVRGEVLDTRTDIFSFAAVLYEMTTGRQAFPGGTSTAVQQAILTQAPVSPRSLYPDLPPELEHIINKALEKERKPRYQTAADLKADLELLKRGLELRRVRAALVPAQKGRPQGAPLRGWTAIALIGTVVLVGAALAYWLAQRRPAAPQELKERRLTANPSDNPVHHGVISPDGKYLAYSDQTGLHVKLIQTGETLNVPQPEGPRRSPTVGGRKDGSQIAPSSLPLESRPECVTALGSSPCWVDRRVSSAMMPTSGACRRMAL